MNLGGIIFGRSMARRAVALLGCAVLLFFAAGGTFLHHHDSGPDTACHICQALHMPALAAASLHLTHALGTLAWHFSLPLDTAPEDSFAHHRASRAPPAV